MKSFALVCSVISQVVFGSWNPNDIPCDNRTALIEDATYCKLKRAVTQCVKDTWCSKEKIDLLMDLILLTEPRTVVEIGVFSGSSLIPIVAALRFVGQGQVFGIDAWSNEEAIRHIARDDPNYKWWSQVDMFKVKERCRQRIRDWHGQNICKLIHQPSAKAAAKISSIDLLHLDGSFTEIETQRDVALYLPKVRKGGYILISSAFYHINGSFEKVPVIWQLLDQCEVVAEIDHCNTLLLRKSS